MSRIREILAMCPVMPVIVLDRVEDAVPLAQAIVGGGLRVLEITMRTPAALDCVRAICREVPDAVVGVGTVLNVADLDSARAAGASFGVSPGATAELLQRVRETQFPFLPGVMTPSDVMRALDAGFDAMKLFPAKTAGGIDMLKSLYGPFSQVLFCPTGGIDVTTAPSYLALPNVACVGGSWIAPANLVVAHNWDAIRQFAASAAQLQRTLRQ